jgi:hypothetical protein
MLLLLYCIPLLFKVWQRNGSCCRLLYCLPFLFKNWQRSGSCCCYIVYHYCLGLTEEWFMFWLLYCQPLLFKVLKSNGSCCCYIVYHYSLRFDNRVVHFIVIVILSTIIDLGLREEWFMLFLYCLPLLFYIWKRSGSCCCCYIVYHYCLRFDRGMGHVVGCYIVYHFCLRFDREVVHVVAILSTITV